MSETGWWQSGSVKRDGLYLYNTVYNRDSNSGKNRGEGGHDFKQPPQKNVNRIGI